MSDNSSPEHGRLRPAADPADRTRDADRAPEGDSRETPTAAQSAFIADHFSADGDVVEHQRPAERRSERQHVELEELLAAVEEFGTASRGLLAWEFRVPEAVLEANWERCIDERLITHVGVDPIVGEMMYRLTARGSSHLQRAKGRPR